MEKMRMDEIIAKNWSNAKNMLWYEGEWWTGERVLALVEENVKQLQAAGFGPGDRVVVEISPYDLTRGRITYRYK